MPRGMPGRPLFIREAELFEEVVLFVREKQKSITDIDWKRKMNFLKKNKTRYLQGNVNTVFLFFEMKDNLYVFEKRGCILFRKVISG